MLAQNFSTFFPSRGTSGCQGMKHPDLFPKQSGLFGEEFDKNINLRCSAPNNLPVLEIWAMDAW